MDKNLYEMIFKRKSFHIFRNTGDEKISWQELQEIENAFYGFAPLIEGIDVKMKIVEDAPYCRRGQEYTILLYSEKKDGYLQNVGYLGEMLDLYLASKNIGALWFGMSKPKELKLGDLDFVIMIAISKIDSEAKFRKDMYKAKRKTVDEMWTGDAYRDIADVARFAPSAVNSQPWKVQATEKEIKVFRHKKEGRIGLVPAGHLDFHNQIDIGIFLCFLELCLVKNEIEFEKVITAEKNTEDNLKLNAVFTIK